MSDVASEATPEGLADMSWNDAVDALVAAENADTPAVEPAPPVAEQAEAEAPSVDGTGTPSVTETSADEIGSVIDIDSLPEDVRDYARSLRKALQGDYTKKRQAHAEKEKQYEALSEFGGLDELTQAVQFVQQWQTDPSGTFRQIEEHMRSQGLLEDATPTPAVVEPEVDPVLSKLSEEMDESDPVFQTLKEMRELAKTLTADKAALEQAREQEARERALNEKILENAKIEAALRQDNPEWVDDDIDDIVDLGIAMGGDLTEAARRFEQLESRIIQRYWAKKTGQPVDTAPLPASTAGVTPVESADTDREMVRQATEYFKQIHSA